MRFCAILESSGFLTGLCRNKPLFTNLTVLKLILIPFPRDYLRVFLSFFWHIQDLFWLPLVLYTNSLCSKPQFLGKILLSVRTFVKVGWVRVLKIKSCNIEYFSENRNIAVTFWYKLHNNNIKYILVSLWQPKFRKYLLITLWSTLMHPYL